MDDLEFALTHEPYGAREHVALVARLASVCAGLNADLNLSTLLQRISDSARSLLDADFAGYGVIDGPELVISAVSGLTEQLIGERVQISDTAVGTMIHTERRSMVGPPAHFPTSALLSRYLVKFHRMAVAVTRVAGEPAGALYVMFTADDRAVTPAEVAVLELFADAAGTALANACAYSDAVEQREHERAIIDAAFDGMAVLGRDGLVRQWNPAAERVTGLAASDVVGRPLPYECGETPVVHQLASGSWIEVTSAPIDATGERVVDIHDVTPAKQLEVAKDFFLAVASHELRTPITVIQGFSATLASRWDELADVDRRDAVERIAERARALSSLVEQILLGSRAGAAGFEVHLAPINLAALVQTAVAGFQGLTENHTVSLHLPGSLPRVLADPSATEIVIGQLIENAVKYSPDGGGVEVCAEVRDGHVAVSVADEGIGLSEGDLERIFDRFYQVGPKNRRRFGGVGLGLYIVRRLMEAQHGTVAARPRGDGGSVFEVTLPVA